VVERFELKRRSLAPADTQGVLFPSLFCGVLCCLSISFCGPRRISFCCFFVRCLASPARHSSFPPSCDTVRASSSHTSVRPFTSSYTRQPVVQTPYRPHLESIVRLSYSGFRSTPLDSRRSLHRRSPSSLHRHGAHSVSAVVTSSLGVVPTRSRRTVRASADAGHVRIPARAAASSPPILSTF
jgi:hypothetical protein